MPQAQRVPDRIMTAEQHIRDRIIGPYIDIGPMESRTLYEDIVALLKEYETLRRANRWLSDILVSGIEEDRRRMSLSRPN